jgi:hypothetical protein
MSLRRYRLRVIRGGAQASESPIASFARGFIATVPCGVPGPADGSFGGVSPGVERLFRQESRHGG